MPLIDFRPVYRELLTVEKGRLATLKDAAHELDMEFDAIGVHTPERIRYIALARTHLEAAVMYAVKALTA